ncbi:NAD-dependent epimerase/dehydratase family protein [Gulosibacter macacae]|uniref:NAD-dependent epimerase/dehydratase family protein n=1 Tax=Gulosibacter macacae TaxID=2488791 RepID=A0A3P3VUW4_9MICO|nr:NAD-dependent epimerase/dehydratase family protein [Gulosibacter macacae]RRJ86244.1 NAD-dependent epimerase/dehydratase family protein [Gulosibacter macacae]
MWIVTGAAGFLGNVLVRELRARGERVRAVLRSSIDPESLRGVDCERIQGDVLDAASLEQAFATPPGVTPIIVHAAGLVSIERKVPLKVRETNVEGTRNVIAASRKIPGARLVYVSSVHALPESTAGPIRETLDIDPERVVGEYAKTKAIATSLVLAASAPGADLDAVVVHPSGIIGPGDYGQGALTALVDSLVRGRLPFVVEGGYDFVDVRDLAGGIIDAARFGCRGRNYILSGGFHSIGELSGIVSRAADQRPRAAVPIWLARCSAPFAELWAKITRTPALFTSYSLHTLSSNGAFDHSRATSEFDYSPRPFDETIRDAVDWVRTRDQAAESAQ